MSLEPVQIDIQQALPYLPRRRLLACGATLVSVCQPHLHRGSIAVYFRIGSGYEPPEMNGISHFLEHMMFRGTRRHPSTHALNLAVERLGGTLFAATSPMSTEFELMLPQESLGAGAALLATILTSPAFSDIDIERRIIEEEILEDYDEEGHSIDIDFLSRARMWPGHPLGQSVTGPLDNVLRFSKRDVREHHKQHYTGGNAVICLSGAFDAATLEPIVEESFAGLRRGGLPTLSTPPPLGPGPTAVHAPKPGSQTEVRVAFHAPGENDPDNVALSILIGILDDGMSTRLHRRIFDERGLAYNLSAGIESYPDVAALTIDAACSHQNVAEVVEQILVLARELVEMPVDRDELDKAKRRAAWGLESLLDEPPALSLWYGEQSLFRMPPILDARARELAAVTVEDVTRVARRVFCARQLHVTTVGVQGDDATARIDRALSRFS